MKVINPTDKTISILYKGVTYTVEAEGEKSGIPEAAATYWKTMIHQFIKVEEDGAVTNTIPSELITEEMRDAGVDESTPVMSREELVKEIGEEEVKKIESEPIVIKSKKK